MKFFKEQVEFLRKTWFAFWIPASLTVSFVVLSFVDLHWAYQAAVVFGSMSPGIISLIRRVDAQEKGRAAANSGRQVVSLTARRQHFSRAELRPTWWGSFISKFARMWVDKQASPPV